MIHPIKPSWSNVGWAISPPIRRQRRLLTGLAWLAMLLCACPAHATDINIKPFVSGSAALIEQRHLGRPYVLSLWSITCPPCMEDLPQFARLARKYPSIDWIVISTDRPQDREAIVQTLTKANFDRAEHWVFADDFTEKLRFEVDRHWYGTLPRTYLIDENGQRRGFSGQLKSRGLEIWLRQHRRRR